MGLGWEIHALEQAGLCHAPLEIGSGNEAHPVAFHSMFPIIHALRELERLSVRTWEPGLTLTPLS